MRGCRSDGLFDQAAQKRDLVKDNGPCMLESDTMRCSIDYSLTLGICSRPIVATAGSYQAALVGLFVLNFFFLSLDFYQPRYALTQKVFHVTSVRYECNHACSQRDRIFNLAHRGMQKRAVLLDFRYFEQMRCSIMRHFKSDACALMPSTILSLSRSFICPPLSQHPLAPASEGAL